MDIQLNTRINLQLQEISKQQQRPINEILKDAISLYVEQHTQESAFREQVHQILTAHRWLLDELDKQ